MQIYSPKEETNILPQLCVKFEKTARFTTKNEVETYFDSRFNLHFFIGADNGTWAGHCSIWL